MSTFSLQVVPLSTFAIIVNLKPILVILLACFLGIDTLSVKKVILIFISFIGASLIVNPDWFANIYNKLMNIPTDPVPVHKTFEKGLNK